MLGVVGRGVRAKYGLRPDAAADGRLAVREALELVATRSRETGYLVGDHFTLADLTAASSLAMIFGAAHPDMTMPPRPAALQSLVDELSAHPGRRWLDTVYERHRRGPAL
jgi:glutathione S-transferase